MSEAADSSPLMKQYHELKAQVPDSLLLFRMGDFYELFGDDAVTAAQILEITLTSRDKNKPNPIPMAGVPHHSAQSYIQRLLKAGRKVAIGEQMEDPATKTGKSIVRREIVRVFTPGVQFDAETSETAYLATVVPAAEGVREAKAQWLLACVDASTGDLRLGAPASADEVLADLGSLPIRHLLVHHGLPPQIRSFFGAGSGVLVEELASNYLAQPQAEDVLKRQYGLETLPGFFPSPAAVRAAGILVTYVLRTQKQDRLGHLRLPLPLHQSRALVLGPRTPQHLDLVGDEGPNLFSFINRTRSALGARALRRWLLEPLRAPSEIDARQKAVRELASKDSLMSGLGAALGEVYDLERISGRVSARLANPRDTLALGKSLAALPRLGQLLGETRYEALGRLAAQLSDAHQRLAPLVERILKTQREEAPLVSREGGIFSKGTTPELDRLISLTEDGERWLIELEAREREATKIPSLKVRYNRVFGYYIEVTQAHLASVPKHYQRKQTTVGAERFFTDELKKFEEEILTAGTRQKQLEQELFEQLVAAIRDQSDAVMDAARGLGELDALLSLARLSEEPGWVFPQIDDGLDLEIRAGRHPLVDQAMRGKFVPNDTVFASPGRGTLLITGPNMGGKSTVMRQVALIVILGQLGAPVPAREARWGAFSSVYTRIGAQDAIARGQSTFMVEMSELAHILHHADERSLLVLDEIGRGTSTYDGISVAWSALEWICTRIRARTLFATHYHELTRLAGILPSLANTHMAVEGARALQGGGLRFLYQLREGPAAESFGIHVAKLAGLPGPVVEKAWKVLEELERQSPAASGGGSANQLSLFEGASPPRPVEAPAEPAPEPILPEWMGVLKEANLNEMTPVQALNFLVRLQDEAKGLA